MQILKATGLKKHYRVRGETVEAVKNLSLSCAAGEVVAFLGANGAGKTTTLKMLTGLVRPDAGTVEVCGEDPNRDPKALRQIGAVLEGNRNLYWKLSVQENLEYFGVLKGLNHRQARSRAAELLQRFGLTEKKNTLVFQLSRGMQQKLAIALSVIHQPRLLLLDEPTLGLDVEATLGIKSMVMELAEQGQAILLTTHQLDVAQELSTRVVIMRQGEILTEKPTGELIAEYSGQSYTIQFAGELDTLQQHKLRSLPVNVQEDRLLYFGSPAGLYEVLDVLRPLDIRHLEPTIADLTDIFLHLQKGALHV
ncbi:ABC transporter ATP-binding protein [Deinococcus roseus]|uniref:ABC transporter ATP-binding protein n=1 Tax=Deinococcus roseus TaxID=392414 RepID=A0ABQ2DDZ3_9DEIO|nr:ABC transporter ATP-binding protein [Deinococcus roseus]GGJ54855.1 ABC transporter ATP-binding protein [Deinococcus roseus]